ncbi:GDP-fucose transporter 1-like isoform X2 [Symsagittifera roscoffensis]|uniref:GDP-fucose transporter 1-like isoform X2 n=1 Tax=Symsagittifera roscoffensis TaxID=84072 RepID=UPI00307B5A4A
MAGSGAGFNGANESLAKQYFKVLVVVSAYWAVSLSMVFLNKYLLNGDSLQLDAPMFVTWFQCLVTVIICVILRIAALQMPTYVSFPSVAINISISLQVLPLSLVFVGMIMFNNLCLQYVGVAFYNVGRSLTTVFNVVFSFVILGQKTSLSALACCGIIVGGFFLGIDQEKESVDISYKGVVCGVLASCCVALNAIFTKRVLPVVDNSVWLLTYYNNINASFLFLPLILMNGEVGTLISFPYIGFASFWAAMNLSGVLGISIAYVSGLQIQVTSPLTHNISGTAKACVQTVIACVFFQQSKSYLWWTSNFMSLGGSLGYTRVKQLEMKQQHEEKKKDSNI